jgi:hypothetical protein
LADELIAQIEQQIQRSMTDAQEVYRRELVSLVREVRRLAKQVDALSRRRSRARVGKWVPGGPGRPPKDAAERIAAFERRRRDE